MSAPQAAPVASRNFTLSIPPAELRQALADLSDLNKTQAIIDPEQITLAVTDLNYTVKTFFDLADSAGRVIERTKPTHSGNTSFDQEQIKPFASYTWKDCPIADKGIISVQASFELSKVLNPCPESLKAYWMTVRIDEGRVSDARLTRVVIDPEKGACPVEISGKDLVEVFASHRAFFVFAANTLKIACEVARNKMATSIRVLPDNTEFFARSWPLQS